MSRFTIGIVGYDRDPNAKCFEDFARALADALRTLGHDVVPPTDAKPGRLILFGANNLYEDPNGEKIPPDVIVFNTEQVGANIDPRRLMAGYEGWRKHVVWDYSRANIAALHRLGIERTVLCPVGYIPSMSKIPLARNPDIDVLFYGSLNPRRNTVLDALADAGLNVAHIFGVYGTDRDAAVARSKIVLNLHYYADAIFEIFRVSHLLANQCCVVSEDGERDVDLESFAASATAYVPRGRIVDTCLRLAAADGDLERHAIASRGYVEFTKTSLVDNVRAALLESEP